MSEQPRDHTRYLEEVERQLIGMRQAEAVARKISFHFSLWIRQPYVRPGPGAAWHQPAGPGAAWGRR